MTNARVTYFLLAVLLLLGMVVAYAVGADRVRYKVHEFAGVTGPLHRTVLAPAGPTPWMRYGGGTASRLAILLTDQDSSWLGLAHALKSSGVPFRITTEVSEALRHKVVLVYPVISGKVLKSEELKALAAFPRRGGHLIGVNVLGGGLNEVFGFRAAVPSRGRFAMTLDPEASLLLAGFRHERERRLSFGDRGKYAETQGTFAYSEPRGQVLAAFDDGSAAIIERSYGAGRSYAFGFDVGDFLFRAQHNRHYGAQRSYVNEFEPAADVITRLIAEIYLRGNPDAVTVGSVPEGRKLSVMFSYDIDAAESFVHMIAYARFLKTEGIRGTFFIQTKYVQDFNDVILFDDTAVAHVRELAHLGMEVASHTVSHSNAFTAFPPGSGDERYPGYRPVVLNHGLARGGTILGELRVSKFLLESMGGADSVVSFRPGYLAYPEILPQGLEAAGYRFSSSMTANKALSHLPFQINYARQTRQEVEVFEIPVTVEDEKPPLMGERVGEAITLARNIAGYGGSFVVLTHPTGLGHKLTFQKAFVAAVRDWAWFGSISDFGAWWAARNAVEVDSDCAAGSCRIRVRAPQAISGLPLTLPKNCIYRGSDDRDLTVTRNGDRVVLGRLQGAVELRCARPPQAAMRMRPD